MPEKTFEARLRETAKVLPFSLREAGRPPDGGRRGQGLALSEVEGLALSEAEGLALSEVEGLALSEVEGMRA